MIPAYELFNKNFWSLSGNIINIVSDLNSDDDDRRYDACKKAGLILNRNDTSVQEQEYLSRKLVGGIDDRNVAVTTISTRGLKRFIASKNGDQAVKSKIADDVMRLAKTNTRKWLGDAVMSAVAQLPGDFFASGALSDKQQIDMTDMLFNGLNNFSHVANRFAGELNYVAGLPLSETQQGHMQACLLEHLQNGKHSVDINNVSRKWLLSDHVGQDHKIDLYEAYEDILNDTSQQNEINRLKAVDLYLSLPFVPDTEKEPYVRELIQFTTSKNSEKAIEASTVLGNYVVADTTPAPMMDMVLSGLTQVMNKKKGPYKALAALNVLTTLKLYEGTEGKANPELQDKLQDIALHKAVSSHARKDSATSYSDDSLTDVMGTYLTDNPDAVATFMGAVNLQVNRIDMTQAKQKIKNRYLGRLADLVKNVANVTDDLTPTPTIHISDRIGSNDMKAVVIIPPSGLDNAMASIRCQTRSVYGPDSMQERVVEQYGETINPYELDYFAQYAKFLSLKPHNPVLENAANYQRLRGIAF